MPEGSLNNIREAFRQAFFVDRPVATFGGIETPARPSIATEVVRGLQQAKTLSGLGLTNAALSPYALGGLKYAIPQTAEQFPQIMGRNAAVGGTTGGFLQELLTTFGQNLDTGISQFPGGEGLLEATRQGSEEAERQGIPSFAQGVAEMGVPDPMDAIVFAFHGGPRRFTKFAMEHIGSGEGAQAFGHGLYFAENKGIAGTYRNNVAEKHFLRQVKDTYDEDYSPDEALELLLNNPNITSQQKNLLSALEKDDWLGFDYPHQAVNAALRQPDNFDLSPETTAALEQWSNLYEVRLDIQPSQLLDWDAPFSRQSDTVKQSLEALLAGEDLESLKTSTGGELYKLFVTRRGGAVAASELLDSVGIPGLRYTDAVSRSRSAERATRNIVMFTDDPITITKINDVPVE